MIFPILFLTVLYLFTILYVSKKFTYGKAYWFFECAHLLAGFFIAMFISNFTNVPLQIISSTLAIGILWELLEILVDRWKLLQNSLRKIGFSQGPITLNDTALDILLDILGALIYLILYSIWPRS